LTFGNYFRNSHFQFENLRIQIIRTFHKNLLEYLVYSCIFTLILSSINSDILPQGKDKTTNWPEPVFEHFTVADGLPENSVQCILQDHLGYLWFGTQNGLVRYDGYEMKVYQPDPDDSLSISYHQIWTLYEDKSGTLWIGTYGGLNSLNRTTDTFTRYIHIPGDSTSINSDVVQSIAEDKDGNFWIGTYQGGLNFFDHNSNRFTHHKLRQDDPLIYQDPINSILVDTEGDIWVGSYQLFRINIKYFATSF